jgi:ABC-type nitrate/sulfonate/bicarbonate transport system permease component
MRDRKIAKFVDDRKIPCYSHRAIKFAILHAMTGEWVSRGSLPASFADTWGNKMAVTESPWGARATEPKSKWQSRRAQHRGKRTGLTRAHKSVLQITSVVVFLAIWQVVGSHTNPLLFATPLKVVDAFVDLIRNGQLGAALPIAAEDFLGGFLLSAIVGITVGILIGRSERLEAILDPYVNLAMATPLVALIPLLIIWAGIGYEARLLTVFILAVFTVIVNTATGVKSTPRVLREVALVYHLPQYRVLKEIMIPNAVPNIFAGLRLSIGKCLIGMINYGNQFATADLLAGVFLASVFGVISMALLAGAQKHYFPWVAATTQLNSRG